MEFSVRTARAVYEQVDCSGFSADDGATYTAREFTAAEGAVFALLAAVAKSADTDDEEAARVAAIGAWLDTLPRL